MNPAVPPLSPGGLFKGAPRGARPCASFSGSRGHGRTAAPRESKGSFLPRRIRRACPSAPRGALSGRSGSLSPSCPHRGRTAGSSPPLSAPARKGGTEISPRQMPPNADLAPVGGSVPLPSALSPPNGESLGNGEPNHRSPCSPDRPLSIYILPDHPFARQVHRRPSFPRPCLSSFPLF